MHGATGLRAWVVQRLSAIYMAVFILLMLGLFLISPPADYTAWRELMGQTAVSVALHEGNARIIEAARHNERSLRNQALAGGYRPGPLRH